MRDTVETATVVGSVYDSVAREPLRGATIQLIDAATRAHQYMAAADSMGRFRIEGVPTGKYIIGFFHQSVDVLGIESPLQAVDLEAGENIVSLGIPGASKVMATLCGKKPAHDSLGAMAGVVRSATTGFPIQGATVQVSWMEYLLTKGKLVEHQRMVPATTDENGGYRMCSLPGADTLLAHASTGLGASGYITVTIPATGILRRDFSIGDSTSVIASVPDTTLSPDMRRATTVLRGTASVTGAVHGPTGEPVAAARITVRGTGLETTSDAAGRFSISGLPAGTFSVEARSLGMAPASANVDLSPTKPAVVYIELSKQAQELPEVVVKGRDNRTRRDLLEFIQRKQSGIGRFLTPSDTPLRHAMSLVDVFRMSPGMRVMSSGPFNHVVVMHGCRANIYLDGTRMSSVTQTIDDIPPNQIAGIEIYDTNLGVPVRFFQPEGCGVILIWTKH